MFVFCPTSLIFWFHLNKKMLEQYLEPFPTTSVTYFSPSDEAHFLVLCWYRFYKGTCLGHEIFFDLVQTFLQSPGLNFGLKSWNFENQQICLIFGYAYVPSPLFCLFWLLCFFCLPSMFYYTRDDLLTFSISMGESEPLSKRTCPSRSVARLQSIIFFIML